MKFSAGVGYQLDLCGDPDSFMYPGSFPGILQHYYDWSCHLVNVYKLMFTAQHTQAAGLPRWRYVYSTECCLVCSLTVSE